MVRTGVWAVVKRRVVPVVVGGRKVLVLRDERSLDLLIKRREVGGRNRVAETLWCIPLQLMLGSRLSESVVVVRRGEAVGVVPRSPSCFINQS